MNLMLSAVTHNDHRLTSPITAVFDAAGGTVGRADHCTLALPDPERFISRKQAEVVPVTGGLFLIRNVGSANPILIGQRSLGLNESAVLQEGDVVRIAGYELQVSYAAPQPPAAPLPVALERSPRAMEAAPAEPVFSPPAAGHPFADLLGVAPQAGAAGLLATPGTGVGGANPFAGLLDAPAGRGAAPLDLLAEPPPPEPELLPPAAGVPAAALQAPASMGPLPDDFDPFALPPVRAAAPAPAPAADPFGLLPAQRPQSIDQQFGLPGRTEGRDPLLDFMRPAAADVLATAAGAPAPDILAALAPPPVALDEAGPSDRLAPLHDAFEPTRIAPVARAAPAASPAAAADVAALWQAFCRGAQIQVAAPADAAQLAQRMEHLGRILRAAVAGTQELMAVRASTKYEMRAQVTQIQARSNNPLKFAPDVRTGVEQLVEPAARGFLEGPAAMEDAMKDLIGHMIGSVAGMRAALEGLLDRFTPEMLEQTLGQGSMLDSLVPMGRKARLWELYLLRYQTLRESAQDDFHAVFGKAFLAAYEQQVERLRKKGEAA